MLLHPVSGGSSLSGCMVLPGLCKIYLSCGLHLSHEDCPNPVRDDAFVLLTSFSIGLKINEDMQTFKF